MLCFGNLDQSGCNKSGEAQEPISGVPNVTDVRRSQVQEEVCSLTTEGLIERDQEPLPVANRCCWDVVLRVEVVAVAAKCDEIVRCAAATVLDPNDVVQLQREYVSTRRIPALEAGFAQYFVAD